APSAAMYTPRAFVDSDLARLDRFEQALGSDWKFEPGREDHRVRLRGIVGFRFVPERIEINSKLSQNHPQANRRSVAAALQALPDHDANAIAALMHAREP